MSCEQNLSRSNVMNSLKIKIYISDLFKHFGTETKIFHTEDGGFALIFSELQNLGVILTAYEQ